MKQQPASQLVDELARLAGHAEPPALDDTTARRMIEVARLDTRPGPRPRSRIRARAIAWPLAAACACLVAYVWLVPRHGDPDLLRATLPTGDRLVGTAGAHFEIEELVPGSRRLRLRAGTMVFDVAHVTAAQRFEVATDSATVIATGTVFSVAAAEGTTRVHVYEGAVVIAHDGRRDPLAAGASWSSVSDTREPDAIITAGDAFARERIAAAPSDPPTSVTPIAPPAAVTPIEPTAIAAASSAVIDTTQRATPSSRPRIAVAPLADDRQVRISSRASPVSPASIELARADIAAGRYDAALAKASDPTRGPSGAWDLVRGDALRALKRAAEAAGAYESAAHALAGSARIEAAYSAAYLRYHDLKDGAGALSTLAGTDDIGSPLEERALLLHAEILAALNRPVEAAVIATRYLDRFPRGGSASRMRTLLPKRR